MGMSAVLAGGVALYATNEFLTISLLPSTIKDIGGERLYAWVTTLYLVGSVLAAAAVNAVRLRVGSRSAYLLGLLAFGAGCVVCALAPRMEILLVGRTLQGVGGGLLAGLGYALINAVLPSSPTSSNWRSTPVSTSRFFFWSSMSSGVMRRFLSLPTVL